MKKEVENLRKKITEETTVDQNIIGLFSTGSCGKGMITDESDLDATMIVKDEVIDEYKNKYKGIGGILCDLSVKTMSELKEAAVWGGPMAWDRYNYTHLKAEVDDGKKFIAGYYCEGYAYKGARVSMIIDEDKIDDSEWLSELIQITADNLPVSKMMKTVK